MAGILNNIRSYRQVGYLNTPTNFAVGRTTLKSRIHEARSLHANVYLKRGYILESDLDTKRHINVLKDPYYKHSSYFVVSEYGNENRVVATARQIRATEEQGHNSFPIIKEIELYPEMKATILALDPKKCVEISGLAKKSGESSSAVMALYRSMWHHSLRNRHHLWLIACDVKVFERLKYLFGDAFVRIGDNAFYMGSEIVPAMLEVNKSVDTLMEDSKTINPMKRRMKRELMKFFMSGLPVKLHQLSKKSIVPSRELAKIMEEIL